MFQPPITICAVKAKKNLLVTRIEEGIKEKSLKRKALKRKALKAVKGKTVKRSKEEVV